MTARVVCIGIATLDTIVAVDRLPGSDERVPGLDGRLSGGGIAATAAVTLARLGVPVAFLGQLGDDEAGRWIRAGLDAEGVDASGFHTAPGRSPVSVVLVERSTGARALAPFPGGAGALELTTADLERCAAADWVHVDEFAYGVLSQLAAAGIRTPISIDDGVGTVPLALEVVRLYAPTERVLAVRFPGRPFEAALEAALAEGPSMVVVTRGAEGSVAIERADDGRPRHHAVPPFPVEPGGSTLGAGDVFHGGLLAALLEGQPLPGAVRFANATAALACRGFDGRSMIPTRQELDAYLLEVTGVRA